MFRISEVYKGKNTFNIYQHNLNNDQLNEFVSKMLFDESALNYIFTANEDNNDSNFIEMARRFIPEEFLYKEKQALNNWDDSKLKIKQLMDSNNGFYSFFAEALMSYLNYKILGYPLTTGVISVEETLSDQKTGADACMFCNGIVILGEAKFYKDFDSARNKIIEDFNSKSLISKIRNLYRKSHNSVVVFLKNISDNTINEISFEDFINYNIVLSGFILHNEKSSYSYSEIDKISIIESLGKYNIVFYHLPIKSKEELVYLIIKNALEMIVNESGR